MPIEPAITLTVRASFQFEALKVRLVGDTVATLPLLVPRATVTVPFGTFPSFTV